MVIIYMYIPQLFYDSPQRDFTIGVSTAPSVKQLNTMCMYSVSLQCTFTMYICIVYSVVHSVTHGTPAGLKDVRVYYMKE